MPWGPVPVGCSGYLCSPRLSLLPYAVPHSWQWRAVAGRQRSAGCTGWPTSPILHNMAYGAWCYESGF